MKTLQMATLRRWVFLACIGMGGVLSAQTPRPTPQPIPTGPLIQARAPEFSRWTVTCNPRKSIDSNDPAATQQHAKAQYTKRIAVIRTKNIRYAQIIDAQGHQIEKWWFENLEFSTDSSTKRRLAYENGRDPELEPETYFATTDFPGFEWISAKNYVDVRNVMGQDCIIFIEGGGASEAIHDSSSPVPSAAGGKVAYIDLKTRLPLLLQKSGETAIYQFVAPPQAKLTLPLDIQEWLDFNQKHAQELMRMPARPF